MEALVPLLAKIDNIGLLVSVLFNAGLGWAHVVWRREERADREKMMNTFAQVGNAVDGLRNVLSAMSGKPIQ